MNTIYRKVLRNLKKIRVINLVRRIIYASSYYNSRYLQIIKWSINSKEDTNFTYPITKQNTLYLANTIAVILNKDISEILNYISELEQNEDLKKHVIKYTSQSKESFNADKRCDFGRRIGWYVIARTIKPKLVIETGVDKGLGGVLLCEALLKNREDGVNGQYIGTDINTIAGYLINGKYSEVGQVLFGDSIESLTTINEPIDLFINDSDHSAEYEYQEYQTITHKLSKNAIILGDNSHCTHMLAKYSNEQGRKFLFFKEEPLNHWYPGAGIGISF